ncbi:MAG: nicotinate-nucleotide adenylyltransferase [Catonella sp.]|uniref:nicotinate-nucleotide adenylyltransferase n=1 Tax=Catonella sp. TaxID=2382125 RepID=UPI003FA07A09
MKKIGILGGTFNPIHNTHINMAKAALFYQDLSEVWVMPAKIPPNKLGITITEDFHRYNMVKLAVEDEKNILPSDFELLREGISYTSDTLTALRKYYTNTDFYLIIGGDSVLYLEDWHKPQEIFDNAVILYISRVGDASDKCKQHIQNVLKTEFENVRMKEIPFETNSVSSTEIRRLIADGIKDGKQLNINEQVMDYILKNGLYKES